jgi:hypothetical protein
MLPWFRQHQRQILINTFIAAIAFASGISTTIYASTPPPVSYRCHP